MKGHRDLEVWQRAMQFVTAVYEVSETFPRHELYGLASQLHRAAVISAQQYRGRIWPAFAERVLSISLSRSWIAPGVVADY